MELVVFGVLTAHVYTTHLRDTEYDTWVNLSFPPYGCHGSRYGSTNQLTDAQFFVYPWETVCIGIVVFANKYTRWLQPFVEWVATDVLSLWNEDNYSNAHGFPWVYKELGIGKLIGTPVPGTMTAVWWETQIDPSIVFGIPQVGCVDMRGQYAENNQLQPDIEVYNKPELSLKGIDTQLEAAVKEMLKAADAVKK